MLHQELPRIDATPLDGWGRWLVPALAVAAAASAAVILLLLGNRPIALIAVLVGIAAAVVLLRKPAATSPVLEPLAGPDYSLVGSALALSRDPVALTGRDGALLVLNAAYRERFGNASPLQVAANEEAQKGLKLAQSMARRDGAGCVAGIETKAGISPVEVDRVAAGNDLFLGGFPKAPG